METSSRLSSALARTFRRTSRAPQQSRPSTTTDQQALLLLVREALARWAASVDACLTDDLGRMRAGETFTVRLDPVLAADYQDATREVRRLMRTLQSDSLRRQVSALLDLADRAFVAWAMDPELVSEAVVSRDAAEIRSSFASLHTRLQAAGL